MQRLDALIFDLEGTIVNSVVDMETSLNILLKEKGRPHLTEDQARTCLVEGLMDTCERAFKATGGVKEEELFPLVQRLVEIIRTTPPTPKQIYPHVSDMLKTMKTRGLKLAICTNKNEEATRRQLEGLGLINFFDIIAGGNTYMVHKPNPAHLMNILDKLDVDPNHAVFIGDSMGDVMTAEGAGVRFILIEHDFTDHELEARAHVVLKSFDRLEGALKVLEFTT